MYFTGFDVHDTNIQIQHMDEDGSLGITTNIPSEEQFVLEFLKTLDAPTAVTFEASGSYWWLYQLLIKHPKVSSVNVVDARRAKPIAEEFSLRAGYGRARNDRIDAEMCAEITRRGMAPKINVFTPEQLEKRTLNRYRLNVIRNRTRIIKNSNSLLKFHGIKLSVLTLEEQHFKTMTPYVEFIIRNSLKLIPTFNDAIEQTEKNLDKLLPESLPLIQRLMTAPGIGIVCARIIATEIPDIKRFAAPKYLISYSGLAPVEQDSDGKLKGKIKLNKFSNRYLKYAFVLAAHNARNHPKYKRKFDQDCKKHDKMFAQIVLARRIVKSVYWMLARQQPYHI